jgi:diguanylate cyclase (GGDEF)-like protein
MDTGTALLTLSAATAAMAALMLAAYGQQQSRRRGTTLHHGGLLWWKLSPWAVATGAAVGALWPAGQGPLLAAMLLLAWAPLSLVGLRRFHARRPLPGHTALDLGLLALAWLALVLTQALAPAMLGQASAATALALGLYAAAVVVGSLGSRVPRPAAAELRSTLPDTAADPLQPNPDMPSQTPPGARGLAHARGSEGDGSAQAPLLVWAWAAALAGGACALPVLGASLTGPGAAGMAPAWWLQVAEHALWVQALAAALGAMVTAFTVQWLLAERTEHQLRDSRRRLRALANQDALTQVPNRRHFRDLASLALRHDAPGSAVLLIFDIDHFKHINDEGGHAAGDRALCLVSSCMVEHLRGPDVAGRHGGDEFVLLLREADTADAMRVAARIVGAIQRRSPALQLPVLTLSFGMVQVGVAEPLDEALRRADQALYEAKRQGRSRAVAAQGDELEPVFSESRRLGLTAL